MAYKPATFAYFQLSIQWHLSTKGSTVNLHKDDFKLSWEVLKPWWKQYRSNTVKVITLEARKTEADNCFAEG